MPRPGRRASKRRRSNAKALVHAVIEWIDAVKAICVAGVVLILTLLGLWAVLDEKLRARTPPPEAAPLLDEPTWAPPAEGHRFRVPLDPGDMREPRPRAVDEVIRGGSGSASTSAKVTVPITAPAAAGSGHVRRCLGGADAVPADVGDDQVARGRAIVVVAARRAVAPPNAVRAAFPFDLRHWSDQAAPGRQQAAAVPEIAPMPTGVDR